GRGNVLGEERRVLPKAEAVAGRAVPHPAGGRGGQVHHEKEGEGSARVAQAAEDDPVVPRLGARAGRRRAQAATRVRASVALPAALPGGERRLSQRLRASVRPSATGSLTTSTRSSRTRWSLRAS